MKFAPLYPTRDQRGDPRPQRAIREFAQLGDGIDMHSARGRGLLLHHVLNHCVETGTGFVLEFDPARSCYYLRRRPPGAPQG